jgi:hypothetical protein
MLWNSIMGVIGGFIGLIFAMRLNLSLGISDLAFVILSSLITDTLSTAFSQMPVLVLFAKITPPNIEATVFALFTGLFNLSSIVISPNVGILINKLFVGVTLDNLSDYYKLVFIQLMLSFIPIFLQFLIPMKYEIEEIQRKQQADSVGDKKKYERYGVSEEE